MATSWNTKLEPKNVCLYDAFIVNKIVDVIGSDKLKKLPKDSIEYRDEVDELLDEHFHNACIDWEMNQFHKDWGLDMNFYAYNVTLVFWNPNTQTWYEPTLDDLYGESINPYIQYEDWKTDDYGFSNGFQIEPMELELMRTDEGKNYITINWRR